MPFTFPIYFNERGRMKGLHIILVSSLKIVLSYGTYSISVDLFVFGVRTFLFCPKRVEAIGKVCHKIDGRCICFTVSNRIFRNASSEVLILTQDIVEIKADGHPLLFQELLGDLGVPCGPRIIAFASISPSDSAIYFS